MTASKLALVFALIGVSACADAQFAGFTKKMLDKDADGNTPLDLALASLPTAPKPPPMPKLPTIPKPPPMPKLPKIPKLPTMPKLPKMPKLPTMPKLRGAASIVKSKLKQVANMIKEAAAEKDMERDQVRALLKETEATVLPGINPFNGDEKGAIRTFMDTIEGNGKVKILAQSIEQAKKEVMDAIDNFEKTGTAPTGKLGEFVASDLGTISQNIVRYFAHKVKQDFANVRAAIMEKTTSPSAGMKKLENRVDELEKMGKTFFERLFKIEAGNHEGEMASQATQFEGSNELYKLFKESVEEVAEDAETAFTSMQKAEGFFDGLIGK